MRLSLDALIALDTIDRRGSFAAAAEELHRVPSALSYTIQKLEEDLGIGIFDRSGHRAKLTPSGRTLLQEGRLLLDHARAVEDRVRKLAMGWESEVIIAVDDLVAPEVLYPVFADFYHLAAPTRIKVTVEVLGGCWDALINRRTDLVVGAPGDAPAGSGCVARPLGTVDFVFAVGPDHPLAREEGPLTAQQIGNHRIIVVADSSRNLPPRSIGILSGQEVLTVPSLRAKVAAQVAGLGIGYLPRHLAAPELASGRLLEKRVLESRPLGTLHLAWRAAESGNAIAWLIERLQVIHYPGITPLQEAQAGVSNQGATAFD